MSFEPVLRPGAFFGNLLAMALCERASPMRRRALARPRRRATNWAVSIIDAAAGGRGLFNRLGWPLALPVFRT